MTRADIPDDEELKKEALRTVIKVMRSANKLQYVEVVCKHCEKRQRVQALVPDNSNIVNACKEILDRKEGKAATKKDAPKPKTSGRSLDELSDEELEALIHQEDENGSEEETTSG